MAEEQFTNEDLRLFHEIEIDVKTNPDKYRETGKWLDDYYDVEKFWCRKTAYYKELDRKADIFERNLSFEYPCPDELYEEMAFWKAMIKSKVFLPISKLRHICEIEIDAQKEEIEALNILGLEESEFAPDGVDIDLDVSRWVVSSIKASEVIESRLKLYSGVEDGVQTKYRLLEACNDSLGIRPFVNTEQAKSILLITWLLTDLDAHKAVLGITDFENWPWESRCNAITLLDKDDKAAWMKLIHESCIKIGIKIKSIVIKINASNFSIGATNFKLLNKIITNDPNRDGVPCPNKRTCKSIQEKLRKEHYPEAAKSLKWENGKIWTTIPAGQIVIIPKK